MPRTRISRPALVCAEPFTGRLVPNWPRHVRGWPPVRPVTLALRLDSGCRRGSLFTRWDPFGAAGQRASPTCSHRRTGRPFALAKGDGLRSIAFPAISTGTYGYPLEAATRIAIATVREELAGPCSISEVVFACFSPQALAAYVAAGIAA